MITPCEAYIYEMIMLLFSLIIWNKNVQKHRVFNNIMYYTLHTFFWMCASMCTYHLIETHLK
jgi:hypothetical protein